MLKEAESILRSVEEGSSHAFVLSSNVQDIVLVNGAEQRIRGFRDQLCRDLSASNRILFCYTLSRGHATYIDGAPFDKDDPGHRKIGLAIEKASAEGLAASQGLEPHSWAESPPDPHNDVLRSLLLFENLLYTDCSKVGIRGAGIVIENVDYLAPRIQTGGGTVDDRTINEMLLRWGYDRLIRKAGNFVVLLAAEQGLVTPDLVSPHSGYEGLVVPFPNATQRLGILTHTLNNTTPVCAELAAQSNGLRLVDLEKIAKLHGGNLDLQHVKARKREVMEGLCRGAVELVEPRFDLSKSSAQPQVSDYLVQVADLIKRDHAVQPADKCSFIPKGLLFVGPPGNGKSHLTTGFAKQSGMTMVRFKNVRSMWVGETERNLENVLDILPTLKPVVVFVDEIDQMLSARSMSGQAASHEVEQRMLARLLEFMGEDRHRGEILWIGATNRPDLLDAAMLRRFDRVLPFMNPTLAQVSGLLSDLATVLGLRLEGESSEWDEICQTIHARNLSCDSIQKIIRHACEIAALSPGGTGKRIHPTEVQTALADYIPNHDPNRYLFMCLHSLAAVSFVSDLPWSRRSLVPEEFHPFVTFDDDTVTGIDRLAIEQALREIPR